MIKVDMIDAIKVQFIKPIFEDDFVEKGMVAWLTDIEWTPRNECYELFFDFTEFEDHNDKYFKRSFYGPASGGIASSPRKLYTAKEVGEYNPKHSVYLALPKDGRDDGQFEFEIQKYLKVI